MNKIFTAILMILTFSILIQSKPSVEFGKYFTDETMRIDYYHIGNSEKEIITIDKIYRYDVWAGSLTNLLDKFNNGKYYIKIYDASGNKLIYSKGFDSYFGEYQTGKDALEGKMKTFHESAIIPYPKHSIKFVLEKRDSTNLLTRIFSSSIDPADIMIIRENAAGIDTKIYKTVESGDPHRKVDLAILGEGYSRKDKQKFLNDLNKFTSTFFNMEPYKTYKKDFNVYGVFKPSEESGTDEPRAAIFKKTVLNTTFNSMGSERYLLTEDNKAVHDMAAAVPYDAIYIMVNHKRYGGGGIYNFYCTFTTDNQFREYLFLHEFGHSFAGLADEYYTSATAYDNFFTPSIEPVEPNITALLDKKNIKWKNLLDGNIELPTPWEKTSFDKMDYAWQEERRKMNDKIAKLKRNNASREKITAAENKYALSDKEHSEKVESFLKASKYWGKVGAFEGAGYLPKGLYRPMLDCIMFSKGKKPFCKVCEDTIIKVIKHYTN